MVVRGYFQCARDAGRESSRKCSGTEQLEKITAVCRHSDLNLLGKRDSRVRSPTLCAQCLEHVITRLHFCDSMLQFVHTTTPRPHPSRYRLSPHPWVASRFWTSRNSTLRHPLQPKSPSPEIRKPHLSKRCGQTYALLNPSMSGSDIQPLFPRFLFLAPISYASASLLPVPFFPTPCSFTFPAQTTRSHRCCLSFPRPERGRPSAPGIYTHPSRPCSLPRPCPARF